MSDLGFNVWGTIAAVVGTMALVPVFIAWFDTRLPRARLPYLSSVFYDTLVLFVAGLQEGLHIDDHELHRFHTHIQDLRRVVDDVRVQVYDITTWRQDVEHWFTGLSREISDTSRVVNTLRARLAKTQSGTRKLLEAQGYPSKRALTPYAQELLREYSKMLLFLYSNACAPHLPAVDFATHSPAAPSAISSSIAEPLATGPATLTESAIGLSLDSAADCPSPTPSLASTGDSEKCHTISYADLKALFKLYIALSSLRSRPSQDAERDPPGVTRDAPQEVQSQTSPLTSEPSASAPVAYNEPGCGPRTPSLCSQSQSSRTSSLFSYDEERHLISDADLRGLVFLGLSLLRSRQSSGYGEVPSEKAQQASPQGAPRPVSNNGLYAQRQSKLAIRRAKRTGIKADLLYRPIVRRSLAAIGVASA
ncbi:hypothetical protein GY45DRAFT_1329737, partial [Cubamyces sp. BRFM 1775]